jgi:HAD superfamily hydrolase (TIGR01490 family)
MRKIRIISLRTFKEKSLLFLKGHTALQIENMGKNYFKSYLIHIIRKNAIERVAWHNKKGHFTYIISASPDIYLSSVTDLLKCNGYDCTKLLFQNNRFTGQIDGSDCIGVEKRKRIEIIAQKSAIDLKESYAFSDHELDIPMLRAVGKPVAVNPTEKLTKVAINNGWTIEEW